MAEFRSNEPENLERKIFNEAVELGDASQRVPFLQKSCGGDDVLRRRIEDLLLAHEQTPWGYSSDFWA